MRISKRNIYVKNISFLERQRIARDTKILMQRIISIQKNRPIMLFCVSNAHVQKQMTISLDVSNIIKDYEKSIYEKLLENIVAIISKDRRHTAMICCRLEACIKEFEKIYFPENKTNLTAVKIYILLYVPN